MVPMPKLGHGDALFAMQWIATAAMVLIPSSLRRLKRSTSMKSKAMCQRLLKVSPTAMRLVEVWGSKSWSCRYRET